MGAVSFKEHMSGWISFTERSYNQAYVAGRNDKNSCSQELTIEIDDIDKFIAQERHAARITGFVDCPELGGRLSVKEGWFNLLVPWQGKGRRRMLYRLFLEADDDGSKFTLSGFKDISHGPGLDGWGDYSRLLMRILRGHQHTDPEAPGEDLYTIATGILRITVPGFLRLTASMLHPGEIEGVGPPVRFDRFFVGQLWKLYFASPPTHVNDEDWPSPTELDPRWQGAEPCEASECEWHPLEHPAGLSRRIVPYKATDGFEGTLHNIRKDPVEETPELGPVMLSHGSSVRANLFYGAPNGHSVVDKLVREGYDVWVQNWRASIDLPASMWTLDHAARFDHPAAVEKILEMTETQELKAVVHCQGSTSFMMSLLSGFLDGKVTHVVSNAVSLHVNLTWLSKIRILTLPELADRLFHFRGVDPQWTARAPTVLPRAFARIAARKRVCNSDVCRSSNFFYGAGPEVLWLHENLSDETHEWNNREWGFCPTSFFKQMAKCAVAGHLVPTGEIDGLPSNLLDQPLPYGVKFTFIAGKSNQCFLPRSQQRTYEYFKEKGHQDVFLKLLPGYSHLDVFIGKNAHRDVYPYIVEGLETSP